MKGYYAESSAAGETRTVGRARHNADLVDNVSAAVGTAAALEHIVGVVGDDLDCGVRKTHTQKLANIPF